MRCRILGESKIMKNKAEMLIDEVDEDVEQIMDIAIIYCQLFMSVLSVFYQNKKEMP